MKNSILRTIKNTLLGAVFALGLYASPAKAEESRVHFGYNALETAVITEYTPDVNRPVRNRLITNISLDAGNLEISYHGLNEMNNYNSDTYFGRNRLMIGKKDSLLRLLIDTKANENEIFDTKVGARYTGLMKKIGYYGEIDLSANEDALNLRIFYGKMLGKGFSMELLQDTTFLYDSKPNHYTELQLNKSLSDRLSLFGRAEFWDFDKDKTNYLIGAIINLGGN